ncbi:Ribokinase-like protein [Kockovaella imperatae]|uniref:Ribokinase-like protein n=1 Tax=Kockovaella imperatae TaxID=4999 RepID=A0A1Y1URL4_9TREE|nr:Ribokinase-like protein [Kockovaella imperatae]ORX40076.1 Ribokinase-like protein [Kockovaella imperatae]
MPGSPTERGRVVTLESFIIDTFKRIDDDGVEHPVNRPNEIGGAGPYALVGSRMFLPADMLGMILDYESSSFPDHMASQLQTYGEEMWLFRERQDNMATTKAVNKYYKETRLFEYLNTPILNTPNSLVKTRLARPPPQIIHFVSLVNRALVVLSEVEDLREDGWDPKLFWEPEPTTCHPQYLDLILTIGSQVDILSPNHAEAFNLLSMEEPEDVTTETVRHLVEKATLQLSRCRPKIATVVRAGSLGCCYVETVANWEQSEIAWIPAYWQTQNPDDGCLSPSSDTPVHTITSVLHKSTDDKGKGREQDTLSLGRDVRHPRVVDPTGAGNAFMGGLAAAFSLGCDIEEACIWASVAASFTIEQHGLPHIKNVGGKELWNGDAPMDRVEKLSKRLAWDQAV